MMGLGPFLKFWLFTLLFVFSNVALADTCGSFFSGKARLHSGYNTQIGPSCLVYGSFCMLESALNQPISAAYLGANFVLSELDDKDTPDVTEVASEFGVLTQDKLVLSNAFRVYFNVPPNLSDEAALDRVSRQLFELSPNAVSKLQKEVFRSEVRHLRAIAGQATNLGLGPDRIERYFARDYQAPRFRGLWLRLVSLEPRLFFLSVEGVRVRTARAILQQVRESLDRKVAATVTLDTVGWYDDFATSYLDRPYVRELLSRLFRKNDEPMHVISIVAYRKVGDSFAYTLRDTQYARSGVGEIELTEKQLRRVLVEGFIYR